MVKYEDYPWPIKAGDVPYFHQKETTKFLICNRNSYCFNQMGTGKTLSVYWASDFLMRNGKINKVLVASPLSGLRATWVRNLILNIPNRKYAVAHGSKDRRIAAIKSDANYVIINHDGLKIVQDEIIKYGNFDLFVIDELTAFKNYMTDRTKAAERIARAIGPCWGVTGRPTPNSPDEAYGQAKVVNPNNPFLPKYYGQFKGMVMQKSEFSDYVWFPRKGANDLVFKVLQPAIMFTREQCLDLPPCKFDTRIVEMSDEQKSAYERMKKELFIQYNQGTITAANVAIKLLKLTQIAAGSVKDDDGNTVHLDCSPRMNELYDIFQQTPQGKLVVFAAFRADIERIAAFFRSKKVLCDYIYGDVPERKRGAMIQDFQEGKLQVIVIQPQSGSHSITLTASNTVVWYSLIPSGEFYQQAIDRIIRIGQSLPQFIIHLIGCQAENRLLKLLESKDEQASNLLDRYLMDNFMEFIEDDERMVA